MSKPFVFGLKRPALLACCMLIAFSAAVSGETTAGSGNVFASAIEAAQQRTVKLYGGSIAREHGYATGVVVSAEGHILTAEGIYLSGAQIRVVLPDGSSSVAKVLRRSEELQVALLQMEKRWPKHFELPAETVADKGDWVLAVANPFKVADGAEKLSVNLGIVSLRTDMDTKRKRREIPYQGEMLVIDAITGNPGSPGGAVVGVDGKLIGVLGRVMESMGTKTRINYAVPAERLKVFVEGKKEAVTEKEAPKGKPYVGIRLFTLSGKKAPAYIDRVIPDSPAAKAGLRKDDLVLAIGGKSVRNCRDYKEVEAGLTPGKDTGFIVKRKTKIFRVTLKVGVKE